MVLAFAYYVTLKIDLLDLPICNKILMLIFFRKMGMSNTNRNKIFDPLNFYEVDEQI